MTRYIVLSYDPDGQQWFDDLVLAEGPSEAEQFVLDRRDYVPMARAFDCTDIDEIAWMLGRPHAEFQDAMAALSQHAEEDQL